MQVYPFNLIINKKRQGGWGVHDTDERLLRRLTEQRTGKQERTGCHCVLQPQIHLLYSLQMETPGSGLEV